MSKRAACSASSAGSCPPPKKRGLRTTTVDKWIVESDKALNTATWLSYEKVNREFVASLKCKVCVQYKDKLFGCRNFSPAFIDGSSNLRTSAFKDHAKSDMHHYAMQLLKKSKSTDVTEYAPIAKALNTLDAATERRVRKKFEIAYCISKENMSFTKMDAICELEELHGVDLGQGYKNRQACGVLVEYIAQYQRQHLASKLEEAKFFSVQADGSTDSANLEEELFVALYFNPYTENGKVCVCNKVLSVRQPSSANAAGLFECLTKALGRVDIADWEKKVVGFGCDGASVILRKCHLG